jgi:catechol 2,3-dioxygenase-like lactoylglutathione lyase family enzyme
VKVLGIVWTGVRTDHFGDMLGMLRDIMGLSVVHAEDDFVELKARNGDTVELFGQASKYNTHFTSSPVVGFQVDDIERARRELAENGIRLIGGVKHENDGSAWQHFKGPDGNIYEITSTPRKD